MPPSAEAAWTAPSGLDSGAGGVIRPPPNGVRPAISGPPDTPGRPMTGTPWCAVFMNLLQISTGNPPPVVFLVGEQSSLPSQTPATRWPV